MPGTQTRTLHLISQAHLDPVWLWPRRDGISEVLMTFQSTVDRLKETPQFRFTRSSASAYEWVRDYDPRLFGEIRALVAEGRWEVIGGWFEQPDCNLPCEESFRKQAEFGREFFEREFGAAGLTTCGYNVDSFGHCGGLPKILRECGFDAYAFMRPEPWDMPGLPVLFQWESTCGSARVLAIRIHGGYSQSYSVTVEQLEQCIRKAAAENFSRGIPHGAMWFGIGNHGGGPTREHIAHVLKLQETFAAHPELPELRFSTVRDFLAAVRACPEVENLPVVRGELGNVFRGCYAANGEVKRRHRAAEKALTAAAELLRIPGAAPAEAPQTLRAAWHDLLFLQFHDILAGTCVAATQQEILDRFGRVLTNANDLADSIAFRIARRVDTTGTEFCALFALNPLPWNRNALVGLDTFVKIHGRHEIIELTAPDGTEIPIQWLPAEANFGPWGLEWGKLTALLPLPASGYCVFGLRTREVTTPQAPESAGSATSTAGEKQEIAEESNNPQFGSARREETNIAEILPGPATVPLRAADERYLLSNSVRFLAVRDTGGTWGHFKRAYDEVLGIAEVLGHEVLAEGPLVRIVREKSRWGASEIWMDVIQVTGSSDVELHVRVNWQEHRQQLKIEFPLAFQIAETYARMPAEVAGRPADGAENPCHDWVLVSGPTGSGSAASLAVLNDSTYSFAAQENVLRFTLVRGVPHAEHPPFEYTDTLNVHFLDQGWQERRFLLRGVDAGFPMHEIAESLDRAAAEFQTPAIAFFDNAHAGDLPRSMENLPQNFCK